MSYIVGPPLLVLFAFWSARWVYAGFLPHNRELADAENPSESFVPQADNIDLGDDLSDMAPAHQDKPAITGLMRFTIVALFGAFLAYNIAPFPPERLSKNLILDLFYVLPFGVLTGLLICFFSKPEHDFTPWKEFCWSAVALGLMGWARTSNEATDRGEQIGAAHLEGLLSLSGAAAVIGILGLLVLHVKRARI